MNDMDSNMNDPNQTPQRLPPLYGNLPRTPREAPLGENACEREPINGMVAVVESILRQPRRIYYQIRQPGQAGLMGYLLLLAMICGLIYGLVVGTFSMADQIWAAPVKVTLGLLISAFICLPSLYIFSALSGSEARLLEVCGLLTGVLALSTLLLIGFAPVAWIFSESTTHVAVMSTLHMFFWVIATYFGLRFLQKGFSHLQLRSYGGLTIWMVIFVAVALQMMTTLRPLVGKSDTFLPARKEKMFFLDHWAETLKKL